MKNISPGQLPQSIYGSTTSINNQNNNPTSTKESTNIQQQITTKLPTCQYQSTECILYGSVSNTEKGQFIERLKGLCDHGGPIPFFEHNMVFKLSK